MIEIRFRNGHKGNFLWCFVPKSKSFCSNVSYDINKGFTFISLTSLPELIA
jgi:hypothetical protein